MMRFAFLIVALCSVAGCAQVAQLVPGRGGEVIIPGTDAPTLSLFFPSLQAQTIATPVAQNDGVVTWLSVEDRAVSFRNGVVVSTRGLGDDLMGADVGASLAALGGGAGEWAPRVHGYMSPEYQSVFMTFQCQRTASKRETVAVGTSSISANRTDELCVNDEREIQNIYWQTGNGVMVKSRQWISPRVGYMETERIIR